MHWRVMLGLCAALLSAGPRADVLETLAAREGMAGQYTQEIISPEGEVLERSNGNFSLLRPHFFRWEILAPDSQLLLANSDQLTQIDWDLEVVVERPIVETASSPLQWLLASRARLDAEDRGGQVLRVELRENIDRLPQIADFVSPPTPF